MTSDSIKKITTFIESEKKTVEVPAVALPKTAEVPALLPMKKVHPWRVSRRWFKGKHAAQ